MAKKLSGNYGLLLLLLQLSFIQQRTVTSSTTKVTDRFLLVNVKTFICMYFTYDEGLRVQYPNGILISFILLHLL